MNSKHVNIDSIDSLKKRNLVLQEINEKLDKENKFMTEKLDEMSSSFLKAEMELKSKKKLFEDQENKMKEIKKKSIENLTLFQTMKEKSEKLEKINRSLTERNSLLEKKTKEHLDLLKNLKQELDYKSADVQEELDKEKEKYDKKLKDAIENSTKREIELRAYVKTLKEQLESLKNLVKEKEVKEKQLLSTINSNFRSLIGEEK
jgi:hypothetical protein